MAQDKLTIDGNEAAARVAYQLSEVIAIYPITPSSSMGEWADQWASERQPNLWGAVPTVIEMQSEGGAAGALHGALQRGALSTTFTASQGLLLMIPNMYKIAGQLMPAVIHVAARAVATHALSIFGDHSDVMATRQTGFGLLCSGSVQEAHDFAAIAHVAALESRIPFLHFFDGFRTSHEVAKIAPLDTAHLRQLVSDALVREHKDRALSPEHPVLRGTAQNPDVFFQGREASNTFYAFCPDIVAGVMDRFAAITGRGYKPYQYVGAHNAERVIIMMGSGAETAEETVAALTAAGESVGVLKVRLFRPFSAAGLAAALPRSAKKIAVLDRCKEPGGAGEPLYLDVVTALAEQFNGHMPRVIGGRYGLSSKEFTPAMVKAVLDELTHDVPRNHFTVGIKDDVAQTSLEYDPSFSTETADTIRAVFYGLGSDGTVGAAKNTIRIIGEGTALEAQGYFVYDSKKSGSTTISHLRFGPRPIRSSYLICEASFVGCHQFGLLRQVDVLGSAAPGATFLLNAPFGPDEVWEHLPTAVQATIIAKRLTLHVIDAVAVAQATGMGQRINSIMQTCFFALSGVLPRETAIAAIKDAIRHTYGKRGEAVVAKNFAAVDAALAALHQVAVPTEPQIRRRARASISSDAPAFVREVTAPLIAGKGDDLPVSAMPVDGTWPTGTSRYEKRGIALEIPVWDESLCIQCGKCVLVCPHAAVRAKLAEPEALFLAPDGYKSAPAKWREFSQQRYTLEVAPDDCTGCTLCVEVCPAEDKKERKEREERGEKNPRVRKALAMRDYKKEVEAARLRWEFFLALADPPRATLKTTAVKDVQLLQPLFEFSGACAGCGETPYLRTLTQLFGDRSIIANATGCSSIYGGNLPTTPWTVNKLGRGPAWANSLFEDNAEFGLGMRIALDQQRDYARQLVAQLRDAIGAELADALLAPLGMSESEVAGRHARIAELKTRLAGVEGPKARDLLAMTDVLDSTQVWIIGGDGWAYDIGYGGLDHVLQSGRNLNIIVLDTEVYSNTGGQASKATPRGAVAKFAAAGRPAAKKDLAYLAITYGNVYVAQINLGADDAQTLKAMNEAAAWNGPSLIIAYGPCINHGIDMARSLDQAKAAVKSGYWPLFRFHPAEGGRPARFDLDSKTPSVPLTAFTANEPRYQMLVTSNPEAAKRLAAEAQHDVDVRWRRYAMLAETLAAENAATGVEAAKA